MLIQGVIFDMDGTLVDSEPLWKEAELEVFHNSGLEISERYLIDARGLPTLDAVKFWLNNLKYEGISPDLLASQINSRAEELILGKGKIMPGAIDALKFLKDKGLPLAVASSSSMHLIKHVVRIHQMDLYFDLLFSGDDEPHGKPHPGIFLSAARKLNIDPRYCVVFEDSVNGIFAAKAAKMKVVALLNDSKKEDTKYEMADLKLESFHNFGNSEYEYLELLMKKG
ncbi:MAG: hexitol phosphatase HxpB [Bacteroidales bacterium]|nr:hexitol phosphatase HxpB [Bacteroidales bacterium]